MNKIKISILGLIFLAIASCGPSAEEKAIIEKARMDSIADATQRAVELRTKLESNLKIIEGNIVTLKAELDVEKNEMEKIQEFHLMRTDAERQQQVREQSKRIQSLESQIQEQKVTREQTLTNLKKVQETLN